MFDTYFGAKALEFSTLLEVTEVVTMYVHASCKLPARCSSFDLGLEGTKNQVELMTLRSVREAVTVFGAHPLEFSTLLELPEVGTIYSHKSCKRPAR